LPRKKFWGRGVKQAPQGKNMKMNPLYHREGAHLKTKWTHKTVVTSNSQGNTILKKRGPSRKPWGVGKLGE